MIYLLIPIVLARVIWLACHIVEDRDFEYRHRRKPGPPQ